MVRDFPVFSQNYILRQRLPLLDTVHRRLRHAASSDPSSSSFSPSWLLKIGITIVSSLRRLVDAVVITGSISISFSYWLSWCSTLLSSSYMSFFNVATCSSNDASTSALVTLLTDRRLQQTLYLWLVGPVPRWLLTKCLVREQCLTLHDNVDASIPWNIFSNSRDVRSIRSPAWIWFFLFAVP